MYKKTIKKSIDIHAPREKVWQALFDPHMTDTWSSEFSPGSYVEGNWDVGGSVSYKDKEGNGLQARVVEKRPNELLRVEMETILNKGFMEPDNPSTADWRGCMDSYRLSTKDGVTNLAIESQIPATESEELFSSGWERALNKIKELTED